MRVKRVLYLFIFIFPLFYVKNLYALIGFNDAIFPEFTTNGRALAMGNAYIAKVDDSSAAVYNPAGLGTVRYPHIHLSNFHVETNKGWNDVGTTGKFTDAASDFPKAFSLDGVRQLLKEKPGNITYARYHLMPNFTARYFSAGYLYSKQTRARLDADPNALFEYADRVDHGPYAALNISLFGGIIKAGATATLLNRKEVFGEQDRNTAVEIADSDYKTGLSTQITSGFRLTLPVAYLPTFAATIHNSTQEDFSATGEGSAPDPIKQSIDVGVSITPQIGKLIRIHFEFNYKDVNYAYQDVNSIRRMLFGAELDFARTFFMRGGYGDGYGSFGLGIRTKKLEFDMTSYAMDSTGSAYRGKEDRHFSVTISSGF